MSDDVWLFSYGTLQQDDVQLATFGRRLEGRADALPGYATSLFEITDADVIATSGKSHHLMARPTGNPADEVAGVAFRITPAELAAADTYEVSAYKRIGARLKSGLEAEQTNGLEPISAVTTGEVISLMLHRDIDDDTRAELKEYLTARRGLDGELHWLIGELGLQP